MMYGDPSYSGKLIWLTIGTANISQWRYVLGMVLAFDEDWVLFWVDFIYEHYDGVKLLICCSK